MKTIALLCGGLIAATLATTAQAQSYTHKAELDLAADGETFAIGATSYRRAPAATVELAPAQADHDSEVIVGRYAVRPPALSSGRAKRAADAPATSAAARTPLGAAISDDGAVVILAPELNVYVDSPAALQRLARDSGGKLLYSSAAGGKATLGFDSVDEAFAAMQRLRGMAGVKEASPRLVAPRRVAR